MAVGYKSSKDGTVTWEAGAIADVTNIQFDDDSNTQRHQTSSTAGKFRRNSGGDDVSGTFVIMRDGCPFSKGDTGTLVITSDGTETLFTGLVYIENIAWSVPIDGGANVQGTVRWGQTVA